MAKINGVTVTQFKNLNIQGTIYVNGVAVVNSGSAPISASDSYTQLGDVAVDRLYLNGSEITGSGSTIPTNFAGTRLGSINITNKLAIDGAEFLDAISLYDEDRSTAGQIVVSGDNNETATGTSTATMGSILTFSSVGVDPTTISGSYQVEWFFEDRASNFSHYMGFADEAFDTTVNQFIGQNSASSRQSIGLRPGTLFRNSIGGSGSTSVATFGAGVYIQAVITDNSTIAFYSNGTLLTTLDLVATGFSTNWTGVLSPASSLERSNDTNTLNITGPFNNTIAGASPWSDLLQVIYGAQR